MQNYNITDVKMLSTIDGYSMRKALGDRIAAMYDETATLWEYAGRLRGCGQNIVVRTYETGDTEIAHALFCRCRLCPMCAWRRSLKAYGQLSEIMNYCDTQRTLEKGKPYRYILITLTVENCDPMELPEVIDRMYAGFTRLTHAKEWRRAIKGAHRSLEVTFNATSLTFHPHLHVICAVSPSYFTSSSYLSQQRLSELWQVACRLPYQPICDVRKVSDTDTAKREVSKYATKEGSFAALPLLDGASVLTALHVGLENRKLFARYGVFRDASRKLRMSDEDGDLIEVGEVDPKIRKDLNYSLIAYTYAPTTGYFAVEWDAVPDWQKSVYNALYNTHERELDKD